jgi:hypothetical protein
LAAINGLTFNNAIALMNAYLKQFFVDTARKNPIPEENRIAGWPGEIRSSE